MQPIEVSEQLALRPLELRDADELFELTDRNRAYLRHWLPWLDNITRPEDTRAFRSSCPGTRVAEQRDAAGDPAERSDCRNRGASQDRLAESPDLVGILD